MRDYLSTFVEVELDEDVPFHHPDRASIGFAVETSKLRRVPCVQNVVRVHELTHAGHIGIRPYILNDCSFDRLHLTRCTPCMRTATRMEAGTKRAILRRNLRRGASDSALLVAAIMFRVELAT